MKTRGLATRRLRRHAPSHRIPPRNGATGATARIRYDGAGRQAFTLIELMVVIVILGILAAVLIPRLGEAADTAHAKIAKTYLAQLDAAIAEYEDQFGDYPSSTFPEKLGLAPNAHNVGAEVLVLSLWSPDWGGANLAEDKLVNLDADETKKPLASLASPKLFELGDEWGTPIAYIHRRDYGKQFTYVTEDPVTGEKRESTVTARQNPDTKSYFNPKKYQLISAGEDGLFGTDDDIGNW